jgi:hypothetical protein
MAHYYRHVLCEVLVARMPGCPFYGLWPLHGYEDDLYRCVKQQSDCFERSRYQCGIEHVRQRWNGGATGRRHICDQRSTRYQSMPRVHN